MDDEALAPVIAIALLVAIVVAMAATAAIIFVLFIDEHDAEGVYISGEKSEETDAWSLVRAPSDLPAEAIYWRGEPGVRYSVDAPATSASPLVPAQWQPVASGSQWAAGTVFHFCADGAVAHDWAFELQERHNNPTLLGAVEFAWVAPCA